MALYEYNEICIRDKFLYGSRSKPNRLVVEQRARLSRQLPMSFVNAFSELRNSPDLLKSMITQLIEHQHYTLEKLSGIINVAPRTLKRIMRGETIKPSLQTSLIVFYLYLKYVENIDTHGL